MSNMKMLQCVQLDALEIAYVQLDALGIECIYLDMWEIAKYYSRSNWKYWKLWNIAMSKARYIEDNKMLLDTTN